MHSLVDHQHPVVVAGDQVVAARRKRLGQNGRVVFTAVDHVRKSCGLRARSIGGGGLLGQQATATGARRDGHVKR